MVATPPKTNQKLSVTARAELGLPRTCERCEEVKPCDHKHYAPKARGGHRGWAKICRVCQGTIASEKGKATPVEVKKPAPISKTRKTWETEQEYVDALHLLSPTEEREKLDEVVEWLTDKIKTLPRQQSFSLFTRCVAPLIAGWREPGAIHADITKGLLSQNKRVQIIATRYSAKSTLTAIYVAWEIFLDPMIKVMVISKGHNLAKRMLRVVRNVIIQNLPLFERYIPTENCLDNAEQFQVAQTVGMSTGGATFSSFGITSNIVGNRSDLTIGDDVEGPSHDNPEKVEELNEQLNELSMINPKGRIVLLGTYQSEFSLYAKKEADTDEEGTPIWETHRALMFEEERTEGNKVTIRSRWQGMFTDKDGLDWRRAVTARAWKLHVLLEADPSILNEKPLKIGDFILFDHDPLSSKFPPAIEPGGEKPLDMPTWSAPKNDVWRYPRAVVKDEDTAYAVTVAAVDPASGLAGRDAIGVAILSVTVSGFGVVRHLEGVRASSKPLAMRRVANIVREFAATVLIVEETAEGLFGETLEGEMVTVGYPMSVNKVTTGGQQKGRRIIEALAPPMGAGRMVMLEKVARSDHGGEFVNQMVRISYDGRTGSSRKDHDDIVDALAHAVAHVKGSLVSDIADNKAMYVLSQIESIRHLPLKMGGLGGAIDGQGADIRRRMMRLGTPDGTATMEGGLSMAELLVEEDQVLIGLIERKERLVQAMQTDNAFGRTPDGRIINSIKHLTKQIEELKAHNVL